MSSRRSALGPVAHRSGPQRRPPVRQLSDRARRPASSARSAISGAGRARPTSVWRRSSIDTEIRFRRRRIAPPSRASLRARSRALVARYHDASRAGGTPHRLVVVAYPLPKATQERKDHAREEGTVRTPIGRGRGRSPGYARGSLASHRDGAGHLLLVRPDRESRSAKAAPPVPLRSGSMDSVATITAWEPPHRFVAETAGRPGSQWPPSGSSRRDRRDVRRPRGAQLVRQHRRLGRASSRAIAHGWAAFFRILRLHLTRASAASAAPPSSYEHRPGACIEAWERSHGSLGLADAAWSAGQRGQQACRRSPGSWNASALPSTPNCSTARPAGARHRPSLRDADGRPSLSADRFYLYGDRAADDPSRARSRSGRRGSTGDRVVRSRGP